MNIFTDALYLFAYLVTLLYFRLPNVINHDYLIHKFYLFIGIFAFYYVIQLIKKIKNNCTVDANIILQHSLTMSLYCILGYALYVDLMFMDWSSNYFGEIDKVDPTKRIVVIALIIVIFVTLIQLMGMLFITPGSQDECSI